MKPRFFKLTLLIFFILTFTFFVSAQPEREKGLELYDQGKDREAIKLLKTALKKNKKDAEILNYLGLAYFNIKNYKEARKSLEKAVKFSPQNSAIRSNLAYIYLFDRKANKSLTEIETAIKLDPNNANAYYIRGTLNLWNSDYERAVSDADTVIQINRDFTEAYILKSDALIYTFGREWGDETEPIKSLDLMENAVKVLKSCTGKCLDGRKSFFLKERLESVEIFYNYFKRRKEEVKISDNLDSIVRTPIKFLTKPQPRYTDTARQSNEQGSVKLAILFGADGKVKYMIALKGLNYGLTEQSMAAAREIKFEPAMHDGKPVSVILQVVYTFTIY